MRHLLSLHFYLLIQCTYMYLIIDISNGLETSSNDFNKFCLLFILLYVLYYYTLEVSFIHLYYPRKITSNLANFGFQEIICQFWAIIA